MMRLSNTRRPGLSLTEVLVAAFVMGLGIISLMTLFPFGAMQMAQALRDDRSRQTVSQADGMVRIWWQTQVVEKPGTEDAFWQTLDNPNFGNAPYPNQPVARGMDNAPSYPVLLDPIGWQAYSTPTKKNWVAYNQGYIPRRSVNLIGNNLPLAVGACTMKDDITFLKDGPNAGTPDVNSGSVAGNVVREGAFNWAALIQRPVNANRYTADLKILVFHTKGLYGGHIPGLDQSTSGAEQVFTPATANAGSTQIVLNVPVANLSIRSGSWIMDGSSTLSPTAPNPIVAQVANFYRIQSITEIAPNQTILELDSPLKTTATQIYILKGLADVFDRPQLTSSGYQRQAP